MPLQEQLRELFLLDKQVRGMRSRLDAALNRTRAQQNKRRQIEQQREELGNQFKHVQAAASTLEHQATQLEARIDKAREQMNSVKNHKEYSALLVEVNTLKVDKSKVEDQALEQMAEVDAVKERLNELEKSLEERVKLEAMSESEVEAARAEVGDKLDELTAQRDAAAAKVPASPRAEFERLADNYEGEAMAVIEEQDRRRMEYTCGGCYMTLPVERVNATMTKMDDLTTCPNCGRILYVETELKEAIGSK